MLPLPQLSSPTSNPAPAAKAASASPGNQVDSAAKDADAKQGDDAFAQFLDQITDRPLPPELREELRQQIADGVPLGEVLANLLQRLRDEPDIGLAPGMLPVLQAMTPPEAADDLAALSQRVGRRGEGVEQILDPAASGDEGEATEVAGKQSDHSGADALLAKHKLSVAGRMAAVDALSNAGAAVNSTQATPLRPMDLSAAMAALSAGAGAGAGGPDAQLIPHRVGDAQWGQALAQRVVWMVSQDKQVAELKLNPANLGPLEVKLTLHRDQASISLLASSGAVRDALEQALPRLRDMLGQQDIQLAQVDVGQRQAQQGGQMGPQTQGGNGQPGGYAAGQGEGAEPLSESSLPVHSLVGRGLIDAYA